MFTRLTRKRACKRRAENCDAKWLRIGFVALLFSSCNYYACPWALSELFFRDVPAESLFTYIRLNLLRVYIQILLKPRAFVMRTEYAWVSGFRREVDENHTLLGFYEASSNSLPMFRE